METINIPIDVIFEDDCIVVMMRDDTILCNPLSWHWWLQEATPEQRADYVLYGFSIYWPQLDEGLDLDGMRYGIHSRKGRE